MSNNPPPEVVVAAYRRHTVAEMTHADVFQGGQGAWGRTSDGRRYLDFIAGYGVVSTGWNHPRLVRVLREQAERTLFAPPMLPTHEAATLAASLLDIMCMPDGWRCVRAAGGADANEQAIKAIDAWADLHAKPEPRRIVRFARAYHGGTRLMRGLSDPVLLRQSPASLRDHPMLPLPSAAAEIALLEEVLDREPGVVAVLVEPVIGSGGVHPLPLDYLRELRRLCTERGVALVFDEVITGCGRVGAMLYAHLAGVDPDAITLGKGISAGAAAIGAALLSPPLAEALCGCEDTSATFAWTPMSCAVALENLRIIEDEHLHAKAALLGEHLRRGLRDVLADAFPGCGQVRGVGLMVGVDLLHAETRQPDSGLARRMLLRCRRHGLWVGASWDWRTVVMLPPLVVTTEEVDQAIAAFGQAATACRGKACAR